MGEEAEKENRPAQAEAGATVPVPEAEIGAETNARTVKLKDAQKRKWIPWLAIRIPKFSIRIPKLKLGKRTIRACGAGALVLLLLGGGWITKDRWLKWGEKIDLARQPKRKINPDRSIEEKLNPFFIPVTVGERQSVAVIDFSVIWDGLASVRYKKMELEIRDTLYEHMQSLAQKDEHFKDQASFLEEDMSRILRRTLGVEDLKVKIKEIKFY